MTTETTSARPRKAVVQLEAGSPGATGRDERDNSQRCDCAGCDTCGVHCVENCASGNGEPCGALHKKTEEDA